MVKTVLEAVVNESKIDKSLIEEVVFGNVCAVGSAASLTRMGQFLAGFPHTVPSYTVNRFCSSGLQAIAEVANAIRAGQIDIGIGGGVESMSNYDMNGAVDPEKLSEEVFDHEKALDCMIPMGLTSENVAEAYKIDRKTQDELAVRSHKNAANAQKSGFFKREIAPVKVKVEDKEVIISEDDGIRGDTSVEGLSKLKPAFAKNGTTTAGNSSQVTDGAAAVLLARRSVAEKLGLPVLGKIVSFAVVGVPSEIMGVGPAFAIPAALKKAGLTTDQVDVFEINEAFASQATYVVNTLKIPLEKVNPHGGAIAIGHPLGCTGARQVATLFNDFQTNKKNVGVVSMCIGTGMGAAGVFVRE